ncbi:hypothetical protein SNEBB_002775 [Seison nebaliae]|nr:hypothetical protein SNEBB_002775 [Seison nebaliae]
MHNFKSMMKNAFGKGEKTDLQTLLDDDITQTERQLHSLKEVCTNLIKSFRNLPYMDESDRKKRGGSTQMIQNLNESLKLCTSEMTTTLTSSSSSLSTSNASSTNHHSRQMSSNTMNIMEHLPIRAVQSSAPSLSSTTSFQTFPLLSSIIFDIIEIQKNADICRDEYDQLMLKELNKIKYFVSDEIPKVTKTKKQLRDEIHRKDQSTTRYRHLEQSLATYQAENNSMSSSTNDRMFRESNNAATIADLQSKLREANVEMHETELKVRQLVDTYETILFNCASKGHEIADCILSILQYYSRCNYDLSLIYNKQLPKLKERVETSKRPVFSCLLEQHLKVTKRKYSVVLEECIEQLKKTEGYLDEGIFRVNGSIAKQNKLKSAFNIGLYEMSEYDSYAIAGVLKLYLREMQNALTDDAHLMDWKEAMCKSTHSEKMNSIVRLLRSLDPHYYENLRYLITFLKLVTDNSYRNKMTIQNIALIIGPNLFREVPKNSNNKNNVVDATNKTIFGFGCSVLEFLLTDYDYIFADAEDETSAITVPSSTNHSLKDESIKCSRSNCKKPLNNSFYLPKRSHTSTINPIRQPSLKLSHTNRSLTMKWKKGFLPKKFRQRNSIVFTGQEESYEPLKNFEVKTGYLIPTLPANDIKSKSDHGNSMEKNILTMTTSNLITSSSGNINSASTPNKLNRKSKAPIITTTDIQTTYITTATNMTSTMTSGNIQSTNKFHKDRYRETSTKKNNLVPTISSSSSTVVVEPDRSSFKYKDKSIKPNSQSNEQLVNNKNQYNNHHTIQYHHNHLKYDEKDQRNVSVTSSNSSSLASSAKNMPSPNTSNFSEFDEEVDEENDIDRNSDKVSNSTQENLNEINKITESISVMSPCPGISGNDVCSQSTSSMGLSDRSEQITDHITNISQPKKNVKRDISPYPTNPLKLLPKNYRHRIMQSEDNIHCKTVQLDKPVLPPKPTKQTVEMKKQQKRQQQDKRILTTDNNEEVKDEKKTNDHFDDTPNSTNL